MDPELIKLVTSLGVGGVLGGVSLWLWQQFRKEHREDMAEIRDALEQITAWDQAIHSRLSGLGAESIAPPIRRGRGERIRIRTAPVGVKVNDGTKGDD